MRKRRNSPYINYWESATDAIVGLLMVVLLCLLLVILTMQVNGTYEYDSEVEGTEPYEYAYEDDEDAPDHDYDDPDEGYGNTRDWSAGGGAGDENGYSEYEYNGISEANGKCAVLVRVVDADTQKLIPEQDITFEIANRNRELVTLSTHYPRKIDYTSYGTDERGQFYLPEKIQTNQYIFNQVSEIEGYDKSSDIQVVIDEDRDWDDPWIVTIPLSPAKNTLRVHLTDEYGKAVTGTLGVWAKTDIAAYDGTIRYKKDEQVDTISLDEEGYGESIELYLGEYYLTALSIPQGYVEEELNKCSVEKKREDRETGWQEIVLPYTTVLLSLKDSYTGAFLAGSDFNLYTDGNGKVQTLTTDSQGTITAQGLAKNTQYHLKQITSADGYRIPNQEYEFYVDGKGWIDGSAEYRIEAENYTIRTSFSVRDALLRKPVRGHRVSLYEENRLIEEWNSEEVHTIMGMKPGSYIAKWADKSQKITVADTGEMQNITLAVWSRADMVLIAALTVLFAVLIVSVLRSIWKRRGHYEST